MPFAQLVIGSPGAGKSTYCDGMQQFYKAIERPCSIVNLDPANDHTSYPAALDVRDLVKLDDIMEEEQLGPNGGILYALEELEHNFEWLEEGLKELKDDYVLFDCPGQVELFTHHESLRNIFFRLQKLGYRVRYRSSSTSLTPANTALQLTVINLIDSYVLTLPTLYISALLLCLRSMLQLDLTHLNVLTKIDNLASYGPLPLPLQFFTEARSLEHLTPHLAAEQRRGPLSDPSLGFLPGATTDEEEDQSPPSKFEALNNAIVDLVEDYSLVGFETLAVEDRQSMQQLVRAIDRASGFAMGGVEGVNETAWSIAMRDGGLSQPGHMDVADIEERWVTRRDEFDEIERRVWEEEGRADREVNAKERAQQDPSELGADGRTASGVKVTRSAPSS